MSEDRLEQDEAKDDVEAHRRRHANEEPASEDDSDDVEAHRKRV